MPNQFRRSLRKGTPLSVVAAHYGTRRPGGDHQRRGLEEQYAGYDRVLRSGYIDFAIFETVWKAQDVSQAEDSNKGGDWWEPQLLGKRRSHASVEQPPGKLR